MSETAPAHRRQRRSRVGRGILIALASLAIGAQLGVIAAGAWAAANPRVVRYLDMPVQHASDAVLARMRRPERERTIREKVARFRDAVPGVAIRTTCIVGFPGETEDDFRRLLDWHQARLAALKEIVLSPPSVHPPTLECGEEKGRALTKAWAFAAAGIVWEAAPGESTVGTGDHSVKPLYGQAFQRTSLGQRSRRRPPVFLATSV